jgi:hypothetical protein
MYGPRLSDVTPLKMDDKYNYIFRVCHDLKDGRDIVITNLKALQLRSDVRNNLALKFRILRALVCLADLPPRNQILPPVSVDFEGILLNIHTWAVICAGVATVAPHNCVYAPMLNVEPRGEYIGKSKGTSTRTGRGRVDSSRGLAASPPNVYSERPQLAWWTTTTEETAPLQLRPYPAGM